MSQMEMVDLDSLVSSTHPYRRFQAYLPDSTEALADVRQLKGADGYGVERLFRCLLVQFMEDRSDRELERYLEENLAAKWLCGFRQGEPLWETMEPQHAFDAHRRTSRAFALGRDRLAHGYPVRPRHDTVHFVETGSRRGGGAILFTRGRGKCLLVHGRASRSVLPSP
jgi:hypothetical protein